MNKPTDDDNDNDHDNDDCYANNGFCQLHKRKKKGGIGKKKICICIMSYMPNGKHNQSCIQKYLCLILDLSG